VTPGQIVAMGGHGLDHEPEDSRMFAFVLGLARAPRPRVCFVGTATGDAESYVLSFYRECSRHDCRPGDLGLFDQRMQDLRGSVLDQDVVYVGGGNTASLLAVWRAHGVDAILADALAAGTVLCGVSAGMNCWFGASTTDSFGPTLGPLHDGLGFLPGSACPHYDGEEQRRPLYHRLVAEGFPAGFAADEAAALHFRDGALVEAVASRPGASAYRVEAVDGRAVETPLPTRLLGA
jgi:dipeptidase E